MREEKPEILIVGGGPAGSACGIFLAQAGFRVTICERSTFPRDKICGECINPRNWKYFELLGIVDQLRSLNLNRIDSFRVTNSSRSFVHGRTSASAATPFFSIPRSLFDKILLDRARAAGADVFENVPVRDLFWQNGWHIIVETAGSLRTLRADILIGADGRNSIVARKMSHFHKRKVNGRSRTSIQSGRVGVQWHMKHQQAIGSSVEMFLFDSGYCGVVNLEGGLANVALVTVPEIAQLATRDFPAFLRKTVFSNRSARERLEFVHPAGRVLTAAPINPASHRSSHPCAFLVGDARQTVEPFTGEGILFAFQDACSTARSITEHYGTLHPVAPPSYSRFVSNNLLSPALRHPFFAEGLIRQHFNRFLSMFAKSFFHG
ncbi:MAG TPA: FAD-dependent monooxygenase [Bacteroidota bacterium]|nr:FAD-dependent monooxygenase [Bacteroidota bacterium]